MKKLFFVISTFYCSWMLNLNTVTHANTVKSCVDFESVKIGTKTGLVNTRFIKQNNIEVWSETFRLSNTTTSYNQAVIEPVSSNFGQGQNASINNINLRFDFSRFSSKVQSIRLEFMSLGGLNNLAINNTGYFIGDLRKLPAKMSGVTSSVQTAVITGGYKATLQFKGNIRNLVIGGQEFFLDNVCILQ